MQKSALVVDNDKIFIKILTNILKKKGFLVRSAHDGLSALEILQTYRPNFIFLDLVMPNIDGQNLCRLIRKNKDFSTTIVVIISAIAFEKNSNFLEFGANACIAKGPVNDMAKYIDMVVEYAEDGKIDSLPQVTLGDENVFSRTVTSELLDAKKYFKVILDNMDNGFIELSESNKIVYCNSTSLRLFNKSMEELLATDIIDHFTGDAYKHVKECLYRVKSAHTTIKSDRSLQVAGKDLVFKLIKVPRPGTESIIMFVGDITMEKQTRKQLHRQMEQLENTVEERTRKYKEVNKNLEEKIVESIKINEELEFVARQWSKTFDTISDFVSVHDKNMKFVRVNKALASFLGKSPEELLGKHCYEVIHGRDSPWPDCPHIESVRTRKTVTKEIEDPNIGRPLLVTCSPFLHDDNSLMGSVHIARDISQQKRSANERDMLIQKLEESLSKVKQLSGFLPICAACKSIRDDRGYWNQIEEYIKNHSEAEFSHSICPKCTKKLYPEFARDVK